MSGENSYEGSPSSSPLPDDYTVFPPPSPLSVATEDASGGPSNEHAQEQGDCYRRQTPAGTPTLSGSSPANEQNVTVVPRGVTEAIVMAADRRRQIERLNGLFLAAIDSALKLHDEHQAATAAMPPLSGASPAAEQKVPDVLPSLAKWIEWAAERHEQLQSEATTGMPPLAEPSPPTQEQNVPDDQLAECLVSRLLEDIASAAKRHEEERGADAGVPPTEARSDTGLQDPINDVMMGFQRIALNPDARLMERAAAVLSEWGKVANLLDGSAFHLVRNFIRSHLGDEQNRLCEELMEELRVEISKRGPKPYRDAAVRSAISAAKEFLVEQQVSQEDDKCYAHYQALLAKLVVTENTLRGFPGDQPGPEDEPQPVDEDEDEDEPQPAGENENEPGRQPVAAATRHAILLLEILLKLVIARMLWLAVSIWGKEDEPVPEFDPVIEARDVQFLFGTSFPSNEVDPTEREYADADEPLAAVAAEFSKAVRRLEESNEENLDQLINGIASMDLNEEAPEAS